MTFLIERPDLGRFTIGLDIHIIEGFSVADSPFGEGCHGYCIIGLGLGWLRLSLAFRRSIPPNK